MLAERRVASETLGCAYVFRRQRDSMCLCERARARRKGEGGGRLVTAQRRIRHAVSQGWIYCARNPTAVPNLQESAGKLHMSAQGSWSLHLSGSSRITGSLRTFPCLRSPSLTLLRGTTENEKEEISQRPQVNV